MYFFNLVLHDWPDASVLEILENLRPAMERGYSKVVAGEVVLPPTGASVIQACMDLQCMALLSAQQRTLGMWESLFAQAGFKIVRVTEDGRGYQTYLEAELA